jgi:hypothetical protein
MANNSDAGFGAESSDSVIISGDGTVSVSTPGMTISALTFLVGFDEESSDSVIISGDGTFSVSTPGMTIGALTSLMGFDEESSDSVIISGDGTVSVSTPGILFNPGLSVPPGLKMPRRRKPSCCGSNVSFRPLLTDGPLDFRFLDNKMIIIDGITIFSQDTGPHPIDKTCCVLTPLVSISEEDAGVPILKENVITIQIEDLVMAIPFNTVGSEKTTYWKLPILFVGDTIEINISSYLEAIYTSIDIVITGKDNKWNPGFRFELPKKIFIDADLEKLFINFIMCPWYHYKKFMLYFMELMEIGDFSKALYFLFLPFVLKLQFFENSEEYLKCRNSSCKMSRSFDKYHNENIIEIMKFFADQDSAYKKFCDQYISSRDPEDLYRLFLSYAARCIHDNSESSSFDLLKLLLMPIDKKESTIKDFIKTMECETTNAVSDSETGKKKEEFYTIYGLYFIIYINIAWEKFLERNRIGICSLYGFKEYIEEHRGEPWDNIGIKDRYSCFKMYQIWNSEATTSEDFYSALRQNKITRHALYESNKKELIGTIVNISLVFCFIISFDFLNLWMLVALMFVFAYLLLYHIFAFENKKNFDSRT